MTNHPARLTTEEILGEMFEMGNLQVCETGKPPTLEQSYAHVAHLQFIKAVRWIDSRMRYENYKKGDDLVISNEYWESLLEEISELGEEQMTQTGHTPGPWVIQELESNRYGYAWPTFAVRSPQNVCLAVVGEVDRFESERILANARLIAAAPDLLAALKNIAEFAEQQINGCTPYGVSVFVDKARAAIAKATGEEAQP